LPPKEKTLQSFFNSTLAKTGFDRRAGFVAFWLSPLFHLLSRRRENEADAYAGLAARNPATIPCRSYRPCDYLLPTEAKTDIYFLKSRPPGLWAFGYEGCPIILATRARKKPSSQSVGPEPGDGNVADVF
jgi:hypothetical protein